MLNMAIYTQKCLKINDRGGWNKDVLGGKKSKNYQSVNRGGLDYSGLESNIPRTVLQNLKALRKLSQY